MYAFCTRGRLASGSNHVCLDAKRVVATARDGLWVFPAFAVAGLAFRRG